MQMECRNGHVGESIEGYYRDLVERLPAVVYMGSFEAAGILYISPRIEALLGYTPGEWLADPNLWLKLLHPDDRERVLAEGMSANEEGRSFKAEYRLLASDGGEVWVRDEAAPVLDEESRPSGLWRGVMLDVTDHKQAEEALAKSEERHRLVARATGEAIWDNDLTTGKQEWAGATEALFGYPPNRSEDAEWWEERIHPEDRERVISGLQAVYDGSGEEAWTDEYRFRRADGSHAVVMDRGYVVRDEAGRAVRMVGSMRDVSEKRRYEGELKRSEELFRLTFERAGVGMAHVSPEGRWIRINDALCEISGYSREELLGMTYRDLSLPEDIEAGEERVRRLLEGETGPYTVERRYVRKDGSRVWVSLSVSLVRKASGESDFLVCVAEDFTDRKLRELVPDPLIDREIEVLQLIACWQTNQEIACRLDYSPSTIKSHVQSILKKLGVENRRESVTKAIRIGLIAPPR